MKKYLIVLAVGLSLIYPLSAGHKNFGFAGPIEDGVEVEISPTMAPLFVGLEAAEEGASVILPLAVGMKKHVRPLNPLSPHFLYYSYYLLGMDQWWMGCIVVNFDSVDHEVDLTMSMKGPEKASITQKVTIKKNSVKIFTAKIWPADYIGLYSLVGKVSGENISVRKVNTRLYIYDVL